MSGALTGTLVSITGPLTPPSPASGRGGVVPGPVRYSAASAYASTGAQVQIRLRSP